jgi:hypothetical protein
MESPRCRRRADANFRVTSAVAQTIQDGDWIAYIDLDGPAVQRLKSVALPLIMSLSEDQKHEVKSLAHVMGLDGAAASF